jgi:hypothetical protein
MTWRNILKIHPAADLFPLMSPEELRVLGKDIGANGLTSPIVLWRDQSGIVFLLDGRNRLDAIELEGTLLHGSTAGRSQAPAFAFMRDEGTPAALAPACGLARRQQ